MLVLAITSILIWLVLLLGWGGFWRADQHLPALIDPPERWPDIATIIPARDEADTIGTVLAAHMASTYAGHVSTILVDDSSTDGTGEIAIEAAAHAPRPLKAVSAPPLPEGWTGKLWALEAGSNAVTEAAPGAKYLLLTDADIVHAPDTLTRLVAHAEQQNLSMVSLMARLDVRGFWGALLIPAFVFFFQKLYPFPWINDPARHAAGAAGGCILIRRDALEQIGGFPALRGALIDDCTLAARVKRGPPHRAIWLGLADSEVTSLRDNRRLDSIWTMVTRTAFTQLRRSGLLLAGSVLGMMVTYLAGPLAVLLMPVHGDMLTGTLGAVAWMLSGLAYLPTARLYRLPAWQALGLPLSAFLYSLMTVASAISHWRGQGGKWKGRTY
jgi:hopene-associated glycosyltransferase HpnB